VHFIGTIIEDANGKCEQPIVFLNTKEKGDTFSFNLGEEQTIPGLEMGMAGLREGETAVIICSPQYSYGPMGNPQGFHSMGKPIPEKATLKFELTFLFFDPPDSSQVWKLSDSEKMEDCKKRKDEGNELFKHAAYEKAFRRYSQAVAFVDAMENKEPASSLLLPCYLNMAACKLKTESYKEVISWSTKALELDSKNVKALFRRGKAYSNVNENEKAKSDLVLALQLDPSASEAQQELRKVEENIVANTKKEKQFYGGMFNKLNEDSKKEGSLYKDIPPEPEPKTKLCKICNKEIETIQWARHMIKKHSKK